MNTVIVFCTALTLTLAHREYMDRIPNGHMVPNPYHPGTIWSAVGHTSPDSGHNAKNIFGQEFSSIGHHRWTAELCQRDSDGDGRTNGVELGDPDCKWTPGATPAGPPKGHPGICDPLSNPVCQRKG